MARCLINDKEFSAYWLAHFLVVAPPLVRRGFSLPAKTLI